MNRNHVMVAVSTFSILLAVSFVGQVEAKMDKPTGIISTQEAIKAATKTIGDYVISTHLFAEMGGNYYYRITVVDSENEVRDVYVGGKSGKVIQVIEHPEEMPPPPGIVK